MGSDIWQYILSLFDHWAAFMTGGIPVALLAVWERWRNRNVTFRLYFGVFLVFGFVAASFQTWNEEHRARIAAEQTSAKTKNHAVEKAQLQKFYMEGGELLQKPITKETSDADFKIYENECNAWLNKTIVWIQENMGDAAKARFLDISGNLSFSYPNAKNEEHAHIISGINNFRKNLQVLIVEFDAWNSKS